MGKDVFEIMFEYDGELFMAQVEPCCGENNIVDYAIYRDGELLYTVTRSPEDGRWTTAVKNADDAVGQDLLDKIGGKIEMRAGNPNTGNASK